MHIRSLFKFFIVMGFLALWSVKSAVAFQEGWDVKNARSVFLNDGGHYTVSALQQPYQRGEASDGSAAERLYLRKGRDSWNVKNVPSFFLYETDHYAACGLPQRRQQSEASNGNGAERAPLAEAPNLLASGRRHPDLFPGIYFMQISGNWIARAPDKSITGCNYEARRFIINISESLDVGQGAYFTVLAPEFMEEEGAFIDWEAPFAPNNTQDPDVITEFDVQKTSQIEDADIYCIFQPRTLSINNKNYVFFALASGGLFYREPAISGDWWSKTVSAEGCPAWSNQGLADQAIFSPKQVLMAEFGEKYWYILPDIGMGFLTETDINFDCAYAGVGLGNTGFDLFLLSEEFYFNFLENNQLLLRDAQSYFEMLYGSMRMKTLQYGPLRSYIESINLSMAVRDIFAQGLRDLGCNGEYSR